MGKFGIRISIHVSGQNFANENWVDEVVKAMEKKVQPKLRKLFLGTVNGWSKKPNFAKKLTRRANYISMAEYVRENEAGEKYVLVSSGAPAHKIKARGTHGGFLRFKRGYRAATTPGSIVSRRAYRSNPVVVAASVDHPGFEAREFDELIAEEYYDEFVDTMQEAFDEAGSKI